MSRGRLDCTGARQAAFGFAVPEAQRSLCHSTSHLHQCVEMDWLSLFLALSPAARVSLHQPPNFQGLVGAYSCAVGMSLPGAWVLFASCCSCHYNAERHVYSSIHGYTGRGLGSR